MRPFIFVTVIIFLSTAVQAKNIIDRTAPKMACSAEATAVEQSPTAALDTDGKSPGLSIVHDYDTVYWDYQSNGGDERHLWVMPDGSVHAIYSGRTKDAFGRGTFYVYSEDFGETFTGPIRVEKKSAEFPAMDVTPDGRAVVVSHKASDPRQLYFNIDFQKGMGFFMENDLPDDPPNYGLARVAAPSDSIAVYMGASPLGKECIWNSFNFKTEQCLYESNQILFPGVNQEWTSAMAKSKDGKVAIVMINFLAWGGQDWDKHNDFGENGVIMRESLDGGLTFGEPIDVTQYTNNTSTLHNHVWVVGLSAMYIEEELHLTWVELEVEDVYNVPHKAHKIVHWSKNVNNGIPTVAARWDSLHFGFWTGDPLLAPIDLPYIGADEDGVLSITFCSFPPDTSIKDPANDFLYADIYAVSSADNGLSWGEPMNLTNSPTMDDRYPYISEWNEAGKINILYQTDTKTGSFFQGDRFVGAVDHLFLKTDHPSTEPYNFYASTKVKAEHSPKVFTLYQNYPNPFNPQTTICYDLPKACQASLKIFNMRGQVVRALAQGEQAAGTHTVVWDGRDQNGDMVSSGVYLYRLVIEDEYIKTNKMIMLQ